jgi:hypothetical protein
MRKEYTVSLPKDYVMTIEFTADVDVTGRKDPHFPATSTSVE